MLFVDILLTFYKNRFRDITSFIFNLTGFFSQRTNWENYYLEILMVAGIVVYFLNFFSGKSKNQRVNIFNFLDSFYYLKSVYL
jgi:hypothetical protein